MHVGWGLMLPYKTRQKFIKMLLSSLYFRMRDYKHKEAYVGMFSQIGELYNVKVGTNNYSTLY